MTNKEFIFLQHVYDNEFEICFKSDTYAVWETVKVKEVNDEGCVLVFLNEQPPQLDPIYVPSPAGEEIDYSWDELSEKYDVEMKEIWV